MNPVELSPELLREQFTMEVGDHHFPFVEDENCNITGYGHQDRAEFAAAINRYDEVCTGSPATEDDLWDVDYIGHYWVTLNPDDETLTPCVQATDNAFPVTALWGQR